LCALHAINGVGVQACDTVRGVLKRAECILNLCAVEMRSESPNPRTSDITWRRKNSSWIWTAQAIQYEDNAFLLPELMDVLRDAVREQRITMQEMAGHNLIHLLRRAYQRCVLFLLSHMHTHGVAEHARIAMTEKRFASWRRSFFQLFPLEGDEDMNDILGSLEEMLAGYAVWCTFLGIYVAVFAVQADITVTEALKGMMCLAGISPARTHGRLVAQGEFEHGTESTVGLLQFVWRSALLLHGHIRQSRDESLPDPHDNAIGDDDMETMAMAINDLMDSVDNLQQVVREDHTAVESTLDKVDASYGSLESVPKHLQRHMQVRESAKNRGFGPFILGAILTFQKYVYPAFQFATQVCTGCPRAGGVVARVLAWGWPHSGSWRWPSSTRARSSTTRGTPSGTRFCSWTSGRTRARRCQGARGGWRRPCSRSSPTPPRCCSCCRTRPMSSPPRTSS